MIFRSPTRLACWHSAPRKALDFLIEYGEFEAAFADRAYPEMDDLDAASTQWRALSLAAGRSLILETPLPQVELPIGPIEVNVPEGYAYYGLDPWTYVRSAWSFCAEQRPAQVVCIGIRSIGTSLSALVAAALEARGVGVLSFTVRPHGHPFDRKVVLSPRLKQELRERRDSWFVIVDEGPGLSGSSFASVAQSVTQLGVPEHRIALFPSWIPDGNRFFSTSAREQWQRHRKYSTDFTPPPDWKDVSAGKWRDIVYRSESEHPKVNPQHEARKYLDRNQLIKFEGLGIYGLTRFERAQDLADAGFIPRASELADGFVRSDFVAGMPLTSRCRDRELLDTMARYIAYRGASDPLHTIPDGRMQPHEWLSTARGFLKTDAVDHGDNHFVPGRTDIAWDIAGAIEEFHFEPEAAEYLIGRYMAVSGDRDIRVRLPHAVAAYSAFRQEYRMMYDC